MSMKIAVAGQHLDVGESLQEYVRERLDEVVIKYFENALSANATFTREGYLFVCDILVNEGTGRKVVIKSKASSDEVYNSFDVALAKLEKQLRRYKSKIRDKTSRMSTVDAIETISAKKYVLSPSAANDDNSIAESEEHGSAAIIAEKSVEIETLSVSEAVMKMDLEDLPAVLFKNIKTGRINVVYYRKDGNISWVDTQG